MSDEPSLLSLLERAKAKLALGKEWLDERPRLKMLYIIVVYAPLVILFTVLKELPTVVLARKSFFLVVVYVALRDTASWLSNLFTFYWYVQMNLVAKLRGAGDFVTAGIFVHYGTVSTLIGGCVVAGLLCAVGRPLLTVLAYSYADEIVDLGLSPLYALALGLPAVIMQSPVTGALLGMHQFVRIAVSLAFWGFIGSIVSIVMVEVQVPCTDKPAELPETYLCPGSKPFLLSVSIVGSLVLWATAAQITAMQYKVATQQGMFPKGVPRFAAIGAEAKNMLRSSWSRDTTGVAVRSILNNTRDFITLVVALRLGINTVALYVVFTSVSAFSYNVPNLLSTSAMAEGSRQLGRGETGSVLWTIKFFHVFSVVCGLIFAVLMFFQREAIVLTYSGDTTYAGFGALVEETWPIFVAYQPVYSLVAVLGPLLMITQNYVYWGKICAFCFFVVFLPITIHAAVVGSAYELLLAELLYNVVHAALLMHKVTWVEMRNLSKTTPELGAAEKQLAAAPSATAQ